MITYSFTDLGSDCLYIHLYKCIKNDILQDVLHAGEKLPSKRSLAKNLNISIITVENAYAQLIAEGYAYSVPKKGYFVADINTIDKETKPVISSENVQLSSGKSNYFADFTSNQTSSAYFPFSIWAKLTRELLTQNQPELLTNSPCGGILPLREAIAKHLKDFRNMTVLPEQIIIGAGTEYLYGLIIQLLGFEKRYAVEDPGYSKISQIYKSHCISCNFVPMDSSGIKIADLEEQNIDIVHISPSHHFPTGIVMPISRRYELLAWAAKSASRYIIEDDYDSEYRLSGQPIPTLQSIDIQEKVIYINTFTKTLASTVRISYMVLPRQLVNIFYSRLYFYSCTVSNFEQYILARFISEGYFEKHINRMRNYYHSKRDKLLHTIKNSALASYATISEENAGLHFLLKLKTGLSDREFLLRMERASIKLSSLSQYYQNPPQAAEHIFIINYSFVAEENMEKAIQLIYDGLF
ncbi:MAG: PLP-dependent aminotransferase family protein [Lachnospiraceae bacterium]|nr:PLP-dependent aminotransferase family protein [Lachnospiraceae bacterium]